MSEILDEIVSITKKNRKLDASISQIKYNMKIRANASHGDYTFIFEEDEKNEVINHFKFLGFNTNLKDDKLTISWEHKL